MDESACSDESAMLDTESIADWSGRAGDDGERNDDADVVDETSNGRLSDSKRRTEVASAAMRGESSSESAMHRT